MTNGWTPERRKRQSELIKAWKPWKHSTGAKTTEGKLKSSQNALKHGAYSIAQKEEIKRVKQALKTLNDFEMSFRI